MAEPSRRRVADATKVLDQVRHEIILLSDEGIGSLELIAGLNTALAELIAKRFGQRTVARWFAMQSEVLAKIERAGEADG